MADAVQFGRGRPSDPQARDVAPGARLLKTEEVGELTGLSVETLAQWRSQKRGIPFVKISRNCVRYRQSDLDSWLVERTVLTDQGGLDGR
jgi:predicted DNA-binding transcriptional regulator AlpA